MKIINGGVTAPLGFKVNGLSCGIKKSGKKDLALVYSKVPAKAAAMFTSNRFKSAAVVLSRENLKNKTARAIIINSGNANCANGKIDLINAKKICSFVSNNLHIKKDEVLIASTGIIGVPLQISKIKKAVPELVKGLGRKSSMKATLAIMTTDTKPKQIAVKIKIGGKIISIGAMAKGAGMIYPNLVSSSEKHATMLSFITTDANIASEVLNSALRIAVKDSFNCISVDGCMSTSDSVFILANGLAGNKTIKKGDNNFSLFSKALNFVCLELAKKIIMDAEGATKFVKVKVKGARVYSDAKRIAQSVANSNLVKTAIFGENENWGRIISAVGASGVNFKADKVKINFSSFRRKEVDININLNTGKALAVVYTSDLSLDYVRINARYN